LRSARNLPVIKVNVLTGCQWLTPVIPAIQEAEIRRITVQSQLGQIVRETLSRKTISQKRAGGVAQGVGPEFKSQYQKKKVSIFWVIILNFFGGWGGEGVAM
jgi:hypothetical protein